MIDLWSLVSSDPYLPFTAAFFLMLGIGLVEAIGLGLGELPGVDLDLDGDVDGVAFLSWLGFGAGIPILIWLTSLLACFTLVGFIGQQLLTNILGAPLSMGWGIAAATIPALAVNTFAANGLARILPGEESTALHPDDLLRLRGTVLNAPAKRGLPSRVRVVDPHGQVHYLPVEPHDDQVTLLVGESVLLVRKEGHLFFGQPETDPTFLSI